MVLGSLEPLPFRHGYAATLSPHAGTAFGWSYRQPALKGEMANEVRRRGYKEACSSLSVSTPQSPDGVSSPSGEPFGLPQSNLRFASSL